MKKLTLAKYHKKYPARLGDTVEKFYRYELFCESNPRPSLKNCKSNWSEEYNKWYAKLSKYMDNK